MAAFTFKNIATLLSLLPFFVVACSSQSRVESPEQSTVLVQAEYVQLSHEEMMTNADLIFVGKVLRISPTRWNQDNGEYWEETTEEGEKLTTTHSAWPVHEVEVLLIQPIVDNIDVGEKVTLTPFGKSPLDEEIALDDGTTVRAGGSSSHSLQVGDEVIIFAIQTEMAWRDPERPIRLVTGPDGTSYFDIGKRTILDFIGIPADSYLIMGEDGLYHSPTGATEPISPISLDDLIRQVTELRNSDS